MSNIKHFIIFILLTLFLLLFPLSSAQGLNYYWGRHPEKERLVFEFQTQMPKYSLDRSGKRELTLRLPKKIWNSESQPTPTDLSAANLLQAVKVKENSLTILLKTAKFGYVQFELSQNKKLVVDFFKSKFGDRWEEPESNASEKKEKPKEKAKEKKEGKQEKRQDAQSKAQKNIQRQEPKQKEQKKTDSEANKTQTTEHKLKRKISLSDLYKPLQNKTQNKSAPQFTSSPQRPDQNRSQSPSEIKAKISRAGPDKAKTIQPGQEYEEQETEPIQGNKSKDFAFKGKIERPEANKTKGKKVQTSAKETNQTKVQKVKTKNKTQAKKTKPKSQDNASTKKQLRTAQDQNATNATAKEIFKKRLVEGQTALANGEFESAKQIFESMNKEPNLPENIRQDLMYSLANTYMNLYQGKVEEHYFKLVSTFEEAINQDPDSYKVPEALLNLMTINLQVDNLPEAKAYFQLMKKNHPQSNYIPSALLLLGEYYLGLGKNKLAADYLEKVVEEHPESSVTQDAAFGLAKAYKNLEFYKKGLQIINYLQKRWSRAYVKKPEILNLAGLLALKNENLKQAKDLFWQYINLVPESENMDLVLARIGDVYLKQGKEDEAKKMYNKVISKFPDKDGSLIAKMRLAEQGIYDKPKISEMFSVFDKGYTLRPVETYKEIVNEKPKSPLAPLAQYKLSLWHLFHDQHLKSLEAVKKFRSKFPRHQLNSRIVKTGQKAMSGLLDKLVQKEKNYPRAIEIWEQYPFLHDKVHELSPETRLNLSLARWKTNNFKKALDLAKPFLNQPPGKQDYEAALELILNIYLNKQHWQKISQLANEIPADKLTPGLEAQLKYAKGLALENLGKTKESKEVWKDIALEEELSDLQRGYAAYFLAQASKEEENLEKTYEYSQLALNQFLESKRDKPKALDCLQMLIETTRETGRTYEALQWALQAEEIITSEHEEWPFFRYKTAQIYREVGEEKKSEQILEKLNKNHPNSFYGQMAASDLDQQSIEQRAQEYLKR